MMNEIKFQKMPPKASKFNKVVSKFKDFVNET